MPQEVTEFHADIMAYHVIVNYDRENGRMNMHVRHIDPEIGGRIWYSEASLEKHENDEVYLRLSNGYAEPEQMNSVTKKDAAVFFSYPGYYKSIVDNIGIFNGIPCHNRRRIVREDQLDLLAEGLRDPARRFPVVIIVSRENEEGMMDEDWLGQFRVSDFTRTIWRYAHALTCYEADGRKLLDLMGLDSGHEDAVPRLYIFWPDGMVDDYGPEDVKNCSFGRHLEARGDARTYDIVRGGQAFYHKIVTDLRDWNVSSRMWDGFKPEIITGRAGFDLHS
jgi:hypothetical protein